MPSDRELVTPDTNARKPRTWWVYAEEDDGLRLVAATAREAVDQWMAESDDGYYDGTVIEAMDLDLISRFAVEQTNGEDEDADPIYVIRQTAGPEVREVVAGARDALDRERFRRVIDRLSTLVGELAPRTDRVEAIAAAVRDGMALCYPVSPATPATSAAMAAAVEAAARGMAAIASDDSPFIGFDGDPEDDESEDREMFRVLAREALLAIAPAGEPDDEVARARDALVAGVASFLDSLPFMAPEAVGFQARVKLAERLADLRSVSDHEGSGT